MPTKLYCRLIFLYLRNYSRISLKWMWCKADSAQLLLHQECFFSKNVYHTSYHTAGHLNKTSQFFCTDDVREILLYMFPLSWKRILVREDLGISLRKKIYPWKSLNNIYFYSCLIAFFRFSLTLFSLGSLGLLKPGDIFFHSRSNFVLKILQNFEG